MTIQTQITADSAATSLHEDEARQLAADEHFELSRRIENSDPHVGWLIRQDYKNGETPEQHFENNREHFLQMAHEQFSEGVAA